MEKAEIKVIFGVLSHYSNNENETKRTHFISFRFFAAVEKEENSTRNRMKKSNLARKKGNNINSSHTNKRTKKNFDKKEGKFII